MNRLNRDMYLLPFVMLFWLIVAIILKLAGVI